MPDKPLDPDHDHDHDHRLEEAYWTAVEDQAMAGLLETADVETSTATLLGQLQASPPPAAWTPPSTTPPASPRASLTSTGVSRPSRPTAQSAIPVPTTTVRHEERPVDIGLTSGVARCRR